MNNPDIYDKIDLFVNELCEYSRMYSNDDKPAYAYVVGYLNSLMKSTVTANPVAKKNLNDSIDFFLEKVINEDTRKDVA